MLRWTEALFENSYDLTVVTGADQRITFVTRSITRILGYEPEEVLGRSGVDFLHLDDLPSALTTELASLDHTEANPTLEVRGRHKDGSVRWLEFVLTNRLDDPEIRGVVANIRDVTRRKEAERRLEELNTELEQRNQELADANAAKDRLVATVSHEIRAPLTLVIGVAQTMRWAWSALSDEEKLDFLAKIEHRGQELATIIDDLAVLGRAEREREGTGWLCELAPTIREAIEVGAAAVDVELSCPDGLTARADPRRVGRILVNYLTNATRYGAPPLRVEAHADGEWVEIRVRDHGPGVPPEFVGDLFEPFTQAPRPAATPLPEPGTGLGLAIVHELARAEGGHAWYEENAPKGSCFAVRLKG